MNYTIIKSNKQYNAYCKLLMNLDLGKKSVKTEDEMELLELLIGKWETEHLASKKLDPVQLLNYLIENNNIERGTLISRLGISKSAISQILSYKKGLSKEVIRKLSEIFKVSQEAFNRPYPLIAEKRKAHKIPKRSNSHNSIAAA